MFDLFVKYREAIARGLTVTLHLCILIWVAGITLGSVCGYIRYKWPESLGRVLSIVAFVVGGIPILVLLYWLHFPLQAYLKVTIPPFWTAVVALTIVNVVMVSEDVAGVLRDLPKQYLSAAVVCGMSRRDVVFRIQLPLVLRQVVPALLKTQVYMLQATLFASLISVQEIFRVTQSINAQEYRPVEIYSTLAVFFLAICLPLNGLAIWLRRRFTRDMSEV